MYFLFHSNERLISIYVVSFGLQSYFHIHIPIAINGIFPIGFGNISVRVVTFNLQSSREFRLSRIHRVEEIFITYME